MSAITPDGAAKHIGSLLGMPVVVKKGAPADLKGPLAVALINDEQNQLVCVIQFDMASAGSAGAALSRIPAGAVQDAMKKGTLEPGLMENFHEIVNLLTVLTTGALGKRTILGAVAQGKDATPAAAQAFVTKAKNKSFMQLVVPGYPTGTFALHLAA